MDDDARVVRARSFGQVAQQYDRWRPDYPDQLYADVLGSGTGQRVLEAGAGTGRATLALAQRGASVVAVEPDPQMAAVVHSKTEGFDVTVVVSPFEQSDPAVGSFDLVAAAQSWHWIDPVGGAAVAAQALKPGGAACLWWNRSAVLEGAVWDRIRDVYARRAPTLSPPGSSTDDRAVTPKTSRMNGFAPWALRTYEWSSHYDADAYCGMVGTYSDHLLLEPMQRQNLLDAVGDVIADAGGVEHPFRTLLLTATRAD
ncbi:SAM-dependent methyltransferase [Rhodococcus sp. 27YEA15]|uniref:class I SAM-dependent methyltransferase n=1 Tax=Rhodococcus sp. 27YEA15 TaxID=3156259 RepID=UPI003C7B7114